MNMSTRDKKVGGAKMKMEITEVKIIEVGVNVEIKITARNGLVTYSRYGFNTEAEAREAIERFGLKE